MTIVKGQIESLERIKTELTANGITRFNSIGEITQFLKNYGHELNDILSSAKEDLKIEISETSSDLHKLQQSLELLVTNETKILNLKIEAFNDKLTYLSSLNPNILVEAYYLFQYFITRYRKKKLVNNPRGFFFGATENEFNLAKKFEAKFRFCFVSLHPESRSYKLLTLSELNSIIKTKRVQYQINLEN